MLDEPFFSDHEDLRRTIRDLLRRSLPPICERYTQTTRAAVGENLWNRLSEVGIPGLGVDERQGGVGGGLIELAVVARELGRVLGTRSVVTSAIVASLLAQFPAGPTLAKLLRQLASGHRIALAIPQVGWTPHGVSWAELNVLARGSGRAFVSGRLAGVIDAEDAACVIVLPDAAGCGAPQRLLVIDRGEVGLGTELINEIGGMRSFSTLTFDSVHARVHTMAPELVRLAISEGRVLLAYEMLGATEAVIALAADYATTREQFGRPLGAFQAVSHRLAKAYIELQAAGASASHALRTHRTPAFELSARMARQAAVVCAVETIEAALQVFGAIGFTWDHPLHHYLKYAKTCERTLNTGRGIESEIVAYTEDHP